MNPANYLMTPTPTLKEKASNILLSRLRTADPADLISIVYAIHALDRDDHDRRHWKRI